MRLGRNRGALRVFCRLNLEPRRAGIALAAAGLLLSGPVGAQANDVTTMAGIALWAPRLATQGERIASCARQASASCLRREGTRVISLGLRANEDVEREMRTARKACVVDAGLMFRQTALDWVRAGLALQKGRYAQATAAIRAAGRHADRGAAIVRRCRI